MTGRKGDHTGRVRRSLGNVTDGETGLVRREAEEVRKGID